jgi:phospholipid/cholesterol/gamma-HCH transport system permease protein
VSRAAGHVVLSLGHGGSRALRASGAAGLLAWSCLRATRRLGEVWPLVLAQMREIGVGSVPLVVGVALITGAVTSQQTGYQYSGTLPLWVVGSVVAASVLTELGPVITGLVLVGRVGARIGAELGTMVVTEQMDALRAVGRDPVVHLVLPRVLAGCAVVPALVALADAAAMAAGWAFALLTLPITTAEFVYGVRLYFYDFALWFSLLKGSVFGGSITFIASLVGLRATGGAEGVGRATMHAVVAGTVAVMAWDLVLVRLLKVFGT